MLQYLAIENRFGNYRSGYHHMIWIQFDMIGSICTVLSGKYSPNYLACFVCYLKIVNMCLNNIMIILKQIIWQTQSGSPSSSLLIEQTIFCMFWSILYRIAGPTKGVSRADCFKMSLFHFKKSTLYWDRAQNMLKFGLGVCSSPLSYMNHF